MKSYDAIIVGAGIAGLSVARELAKLKQRVLVLEREKAGGETSRAAAGILDPYTEAEEEAPLYHLGKEAFNFYPSFLEEITGSHKELVEYQKLGVLYLALNAKDEAFLKNRFEWQKKQKLPVEFLSRDQTKKLEPLVSERTQSGVFYPEIPKLNAEKLTRALFKAAEQAGVKIETGIKDASLWKEEKVRGVRVSSESFEAPVVVMSRGCWSGMEEGLGVQLKVKPMRGQILILRATPETYPRHILHTIRYAYIIPWPEGRILVGSTIEPAGFDNSVTPEGKEDILNRAGEILEGIDAMPVEKSWAGLRPFSENGRPVIGPTGLGGAFFATGYYRSGILIGPYVGKLLAEGIVTGRFSPLLKPFYPEIGGSS